MLIVIDNYTREPLATDVMQSLKVEDVAQVLNAMVAKRGLPATIKADNGIEFIGKVIDRWAYEQNVEMDFSGLASQPTKPWSSPLSDVFSRSLHTDPER